MVTLVAKDNLAAADELREKFHLSPELQDGTVTFCVPQGDKFLPKLIENFQSPLVSIGVNRPTLEDVFLKLTGRAIREEEGQESMWAGHARRMRRGR
jgi:ABC-2 type transport system ATP-binding protein